jgi:hypothetical protein
VRTPQLEPIEDLENSLKNFSNALKWDPRKSHLLLSQLGFVNDEDVQSPRHCTITLERVGTIPQNPKTPSSFMLIDKSLILVLPHSLASLRHTTAHQGTPGHTRHEKIGSKSKKLNHHNFSPPCPILPKLRYSSSLMQGLSIAHHIVYKNHGFRVGGFFGTQWDLACYLI